MDQWSNDESGEIITKWYCGADSAVPAAANSGGTFKGAKMYSKNK